MEPLSAWKRSRVKVWGFRFWGPSFPFQVEAQPVEKAQQELGFFDRLT